MKRIWLIVIVVLLVLSFSQDANAAWRGRFYGGWRGYGYHPYYAPVPVPRPYYRPYYAPAPVWIAPHYRRTPYGDQFVPGHWAR